MIELGYKKLYCPTAAVYHSHNYPLKEYKKRYFDEFKGLYQLHKFIMVKSWIDLIPRYLLNVWNDLKYINQLDISKDEKKYWKKYSIIRNWYRFHSAYLAGKYHKLSDEKKLKMDKKMSQQYKQRMQ